MASEVLTLITRESLEASNTKSEIDCLYTVQALRKMKGDRFAENKSLFPSRFFSGLGYPAIPLAGAAMAGGAADGAGFCLAFERD